MTGGDTATTTVHAVAVKLSPFSTQEPTAWFRRAEVQFRLRKISDERTKADYVLEAIPESLFPQIAAWLDDQPDEINYADLKDYLLKEYTLTPSARAQRLLRFPLQPLGDRTARVVWNQMQALARLPTIDPTTKGYRQVDLMKELFLQTLPSSVRAALPDADALEMTALVKRADDLIDAANASQRSTPISAVAEPPISDTSAVDRAPRRHRLDPRPGLLLASGRCFYHEKYGAKARNCSPGCKWSKNE